MIALCRIREAVAYRREAFLAGLDRAGYRVVQHGTPESSRDLLCIWNKYTQNERDAEAWEAAGGTVVVVENGYIGHDKQGRQHYAIACHAHNGAGWWPIGTDDLRWPRLGIDVKPWRKEGQHILVCAQRSIGSRTMASPPGWAETTAKRLRQLTTREVRIRPHPGNKEPPKVLLADDLRDAHACVIWSSGCGVHALVAGVPVFYHAPNWICEGAAIRLCEAPEAVVCDDALRMQALRRMCWAQWSVDEIAAGEPFIRIRSAILERQAA